jgi:NADH:ubiquinone oxidoreductase subunit E
LRDLMPSYNPGLVTGGVTKPPDLLENVAQKLTFVKSLLTVECLGSCGTAPMMQVDETYYENLTEEKIDQILLELA